MSEPIKPGIWRNTQGAEIEVLNPVIAVREFKFLLDVELWEARVTDIFGTSWFLTNTAGLAACGYEFVREVPNE